MCKQKDVSYSFSIQTLRKADLASEAEHSEAVALLEDVGQGQVAEVNVSVGQTKRFGHQRQTGDDAAVVGVGDHDALGGAGGAARVVDDAEILAFGREDVEWRLLPGVDEVPEADDGDVGVPTDGPQRLVHGFRDDHQLE